jgi:hypothetical protein
MSATRANNDQGSHALRRCKAPASERGAHRSL